jgi:DNA invertase Pin-like site-specific DNA recombinase
MNLTSLTSADFKNIVKLLGNKEALQQRIAAIDRELAQFGSSAAAPAAPTRGRKRGRPAKRRPRGQIKEKIIGLVKGAGKDGITVREAARRLGVNAQRMYVWFGSTGKKVKQIKKTAPGTYAWVE